jgi:predicted metal-dependent hydrolase
VQYFANLYGFVYRGIRISSARTRWGSCSSRGGLNFTWRLIQAPLPIIDYVVVHELAHLKVPNHSKAFWELVKNLLPDFAERRAWLKAHGRQLSV